MPHALRPTGSRRRADQRDWDIDKSATPVLPGQRGRPSDGNCTPGTTRTPRSATGRIRAPAAPLSLDRRNRGCYRAVSTAKPTNWPSEPRGSAWNCLTIPSGLKTATACLARIRCVCKSSARCGCGVTASSWMPVPGSRRYLLALLAGPGGQADQHERADRSDLGRRRSPTARSTSSTSMSARCGDCSNPRLPARARGSYLHRRGNAYQFTAGPGHAGPRRRSGSSSRRPRQPSRSNATIRRSITTSTRSASGRARPADGFDALDQPRCRSSPPSTTSSTPRARQRPSWLCRCAGRSGCCPHCSWPHRWHRSTNPFRPASSPRSAPPGVRRRHCPCSAACAPAWPTSSASIRARRCRPPTSGCSRRALRRRSWQASVTSVVDRGAGPLGWSAGPRNSPYCGDPSRWHSPAAQRSASSKASRA